MQVWLCVFVFVSMSVCACVCAPAREGARELLFLDRDLC